MTINDREWLFLAQQTGEPGPFNDMYFKYLRGLGHTGTLQDMIAAFGGGFTPSQGGRPAWAPENAAFLIDGVNDRAWINGHTYNSLAAMIASADADFTRASSGYAESVSGALTAFGSGQLRRSDKGLLIEPARTNLCLHSADLTNAAYVLTAGAMKTANNIAAPDGSMTGDMLTYPDMSLAYQMYQIISVTENTQYTFSYWTELGTKLSNRYAIYNNTAGSFIISETTATGVTAGAWHRVTVSFTTPAGCTGVRVYADRHAASVGNPNNNTIYLWGQQLETGAGATSLIDTVASSATRPADALTLIPANDTYDITTTFDNDSTQLLSGEVVSGPWVVPTNLNRRYIKTILGVVSN